MPPWDKYGSQAKAAAPAAAAPAPWLRYKGAPAVPDAPFVHVPELKPEPPPVAARQSLPAAMGSAFVRGAADVPLATAQSAARAAGTAHLLPEFEAIERGEQPPGLLDISRRPPIEKTLLRQYAQAAPERRAEIKARAQHPVTESPVYKAAERGRAAVEGAFPVDPAQGERFLTKTAGGLGSTLGFAATGIAGRALGMPALPVTAATGAAANSQAQFQQAINSGASFEDATRASQISGLAGLSEALPIARFLDRFDKGTGGTIRKAIREGLKGGIEESVQEIGQAIVDNATARGIYDPERNLITGSGEAGAIGFSVGSLMSFLSSALGARMRGAPQSPAEAPGAAPAAPGTGVPPGAPVPAGAHAAPDLLGEIFGPDVGERAAPDLGVPEPMERFEMGGEAGGRFIETQRARAQLEESQRNIERTEREIAERQERIDSLTGTATGQMVEPMRARASMPPPPAPRETGGPATGRFLETMRGAATMPPAQMPARLGAIRARGSATGQFVEPQTAAVEMPPEPAPPKPDVPSFAGPVRPSEVVLPPAVVPETSPRPPAAVIPEAEAAGPPIQTPPPPRVEAPQPAPQSARGQDWRAVMANRWPHQLSEDERGQLVEALGVASFDEATRELDRRGYVPEASAPAAASAPAQAPARAPEPKAPSPAPAARPARDQAIALQLRKQAETLAGQIEAKRNPAIAQQNPTARRARIAAGMAKEADMLADVQTKLVALADQIEAGTVEPVLAGVRTRKVVETLRRAREYGHSFPAFWGSNLKELAEKARGKKGTAAAVRWAERFRNDDHRIPFTSDAAKHIETLAKAGGRDVRYHPALDDLSEFKSLAASGITAANWDEAKAAIGRLGQFQETPEQQRERERRELERSLIGLRIPGYFSTPEPLASRVIDEADIKPGMKVLEPSAGHGALADIARDRGADVDVIEFNQTLRGILERKGYAPVASDFTEYSPGPVYDRIVMNPPFEHGQDAVHVRHAYDALKPSGRMVAIMGEGTFSRDNRAARGFRGWLDDVGGESERLPTGSFLKSLQSTGVNARLVTIDKPAAREARPAPGEGEPGGAAVAEDRAEVAPTGRGSAWLDSLDPATKERVFEAMRRVRARSDAHMAKGASLRAPGGTVAVGNADFDESLRGDSGAQVLSLISNRNMTPRQAGEQAKADARRAIERRNAQRPNDVNWARWEGAADSTIDRAVQELEAAARPVTTTETTPEGEQFVIPGAEQRGAKEVLERRMGARDVRGGQKGLEGLGLFDEGGRAQQDDMFSSPARFGRKPVPQAERDELAGILERLVRQINPDPALAVEFAKEMWASGPTMARHGVDPTQTFEQSGSYNPVQHLIRLSLNVTAPGERVGAAAHEAWHSVERLLTKSERAVLRNIYPSIKGGKVHVERAAEAFEEWLVANHAQKQKFKPAVRRVFEKIARFLERLGNALRGRGYQTVEDIFGRAFSGEVGARHPGMPGGTATVHPDTGTPLSVRALQGAPPEIQQIARQPFSSLRRDPYDDTGGQVELHAGLPIGKIWDWWLGPFFQRWYEPFGTLPGRDEYLKGRYQALGEADQAGELTRYHYERLNRHPEQIKEQIYQYLTTPGAATTMVDPSARQDAQDMKRTIDRLGRELVHWGVLKPEQEKAYRDRYLPRIYLKFLLEEGVVSIGAGNRPKVPRAMMGRIKKRQNLSRFERDILLGEVKDPAYLAARAFGVAAHSIAILRFLDKVSQNRDWIYPNSMVSWRGRRYSARFLMAEADRLRETYKSWPGHLQQQVLNTALQMEQAANTAQPKPPEDIARNYKQVPDTVRYGTLRGLWIKKEIYDDLVGSSLAEFNDETLNWLAQQWRRGINAWKIGKTSINPAGHVRNHISGIFQSTILGGVPLHRMPDLYLRTIQELRHQGPAYQATIRHGGRSTSFAASELAKIHDQFRKKLKDRQYKYNPVRFLLEIGRETIQWAGDKYSGNEVFWKTLIMKYHMDRGVPEAEANAIAQSAVFDYSLVPNWLRAIRNNVPIGAPFATFMYKALPRSLETAFKRPWAYWPALAMLYGIPALSAMYQDLDDDDMEALKELLPPWMSDWQTVILPMKDAYGRFQVIDLSYFFPFGGWLKAAEHMADAEIGKALDAIGMGNNPGFTIPKAIITNQDGLGREIWDEGEPWWRQWLDFGSFMMGEALPPWMAPDGSIKQLHDALTSAPDRFGNLPRSPMAGAARFGGFNAQPMDPEVQFMRGTNQRMAKIRDAEQAAREKAREYGNRIGAMQKQGKDTSGLEREMRRELERQAAEIRKRAEELAAWQQKASPALELAR